MLRYKPKRYPKYAIITEIILFLSMILLIVLVYSGINFRALGQSLIFIVVAAILYIATRYVIYEYTYYLSEDTFGATRIAGKIPNDIFVIEISENDIFERISSRKDLKKYGKMRIENACVNLAPNGLYAYITEVDGKKVAFLIESDELFALAVSERINIKKLNAQRKDSEREFTSEE